MIEKTVTLLLDIPEPGDALPAQVIAGNLFYDENGQLSVQSGNGDTCVLRDLLEIIGLPRRLATSRVVKQ